MKIDSAHDLARGKARAMKSYWNNPDGWRLNSRERHRLAKANAIEKLGGVCINCGITDLRLLTINHRNGTNKAKRISGWPLYCSILKGTVDISEFDVRCWNHNALYEYERGRISLQD